MNEWELFIQANYREIDENTHYESTFVRLVLSRVSSVTPSQVKCQYKFTDSQDKKRRIDFVIEINGKPRLALEVDGYDKTGSGRGMTKDEFNDFSYRQNEIAKRGMHVLRFSNLEFTKRPCIAIEQIEAAIEQIWKASRPGVFARGASKVAANIGNKVGDFVTGFSVAYTHERAKNEGQRAKILEHVRKRYQLENSLLEKKK